MSPATWNRLFEDSTTEVKIKTIPLRVWTNSSFSIYNVAQDGHTKLNVKRCNHWKGFQTNPVLEPL
jgi:hypothetical protein